MGKVDNQSKKFYQKTWFIWLMLIFFFPVGVFLLWKFSTYSKKARIIISVIFAFLFIFQLTNHSDKSPSTSPATSQQQAASSANVNETPKENKPAEVQQEQQPVQAQQPRKYTGNGPHGEGIKGNINKKGEKIYHLPGGAYYDRTHAEAWFFTEQDAQAAGYRSSLR